MDFLPDPIKQFVEELFSSATEKAVRKAQGKKPAPGKNNPYDDGPLKAPTSHDGKDPGTKQYGKHWSRYSPNARLREYAVKRRKELDASSTEKARKNIVVPPNHWATHPRMDNIGGYLRPKVMGKDGKHLVRYEDGSYGKRLHPTKDAGKRKPSEKSKPNDKGKGKLLTRSQVMPDGSVEKYRAIKRR